MHSASRLSVALLLCATVLSACAPSISHTASVIPDAAAPDERLVLAPPPAPNSAAQIDDDRVFRATRALKDTPRWTLAQNDADLEPAHVVRDFSCAVGFDIDLAKAPHLSRVLERIRHAVGHRTSEVKKYWHRTRPFVGTDLPICTPAEGLGLHSSYPSGHTTAGYGMALLLAHLMPEHAATILQRGRVFGESRVVCGVHWKSDVQAGYLNASSLMDTLMALPELQDDLSAARRELLAMQKTAPAPAAGQCAVEQDAAAHSMLTEP
ncbi:acid phosphatase [Gluconobacter kanchanaburiensis]|uniref:Acid phosphatase n=1 Tax=Gluconobacter kanchanaburiensis NBRC 103587 TaxID=1307948 RepID=A0A511B305_9PROT|nr:phosphatase PAP2 family protein [Gluconobacter kanchanaburiensis]MBF0860995.1 phosphatase PAP2 family protein [Gluconobacter kanchanaburiensis]GBR70185.1 acid phosphatase precursor [Gluconobacter kanchanaburiensis NBRC 103587]GEK94825.1 acid phosphatase [Gluconobacter kanchanaburiensis NBRC 103587]